MSFFDRGPALAVTPDGESISVFKNIYIIRYVTSNIWIEIQLTTTNYKHLLIKKPDNV